MNRNLDGSQLSRTQLIDLAVASGHDRAKFTTDFKTAMLPHLSSALRHAMWARGELVLDTRPVERPSERRSR